MNHLNGKYFLGLLLYVLIAIIPPVYAVDSSYVLLRQQTLQLTARQLGLQQVRKDQVLVMLMEFSYPEGILSLMIRADGVVGVLLSNGAGELNLQVESLVFQQSERLLNKSNDYLSSSLAVKDYRLPQLGDVQCFFHTSEGDFVYKVAIDKVSSSALSPLFILGYKILGKISEEPGRGF